MRGDGSTRASSCEHSEDMATNPASLLIQLVALLIVTLAEHFFAPALHRALPASMEFCASHSGVLRTTALAFLHLALSASTDASAYTAVFLAAFSALSTATFPALFVVFEAAKAAVLSHMPPDAQHQQQQRDMPSRDARQRDTQQNEQQQQHEQPDLIAIAFLAATAAFVLNGSALPPAQPSNGGSSGSPLAGCGTNISSVGGTSSTCASCASAGADEDRAGSSSSDTFLPSADEDCCD